MLNLDVNDVFVIIELILYCLLHIMENIATPSCSLLTGSTSSRSETLWPFKALCLDLDQRAFPTLLPTLPFLCLFANPRQASWALCCHCPLATVRQRFLRTARPQWATTQQSRTARTPRMLPPLQNPSNAPPSSACCHGNALWPCQRRGRAPRSYSQTAGMVGKGARRMAMPSSLPIQPPIA